MIKSMYQITHLMDQVYGEALTLKKFAIPPQEKMTKLGWKIYANFSKVKQSDKLSMLSQKKEKCQTEQK